MADIRENISVRKHIVSGTTLGDSLFNGQLLTVTDEDLKKGLDGLEQVGRMSPYIQDSIKAAIMDSIIPLQNSVCTSINYTTGNNAWVSLVALANNQNGFEVLPEIYEIEHSYSVGEERIINTGIYSNGGWTNSPHSTGIVPVPPYIDGDFAGNIDYSKQGQVSFGDNSVSYKGTADSVFVLGDDSYSGVRAVFDQHLKEKVPNGTDAFIPEFENISDIQESEGENIHFYKINTDNSGKILQLYTIGESYLDEKVFNTLEKWQKKYTGLKFIKNFNSYSGSGTISEKNPRKSNGIIENLSNPELNISGKSTLVFFVKYSDGERNYLLCINVMALLNQSGFGGTDGKQAGSNGTIWHDKQFISWPHWVDHPNEGWGRYENPNFIPFPYYIMYNTGYFVTNSVLCSGCEDNRGENYDSNVPWQNGCSILSTEENFIYFLRDGLGLGATINVAEAENTPIDKWADVEVPKYDDSQQSGGGTGGSDSFQNTESFDKIDGYSENTSYGGLQTCWLLNERNAKELDLALTDPSIWSSITNIFKSDPMSGIISLNKFPINFDKYLGLVTEDNLKIIGIDISNLHGGSTLKGVKSPDFLQSRFECGSFDIKPRFNNFLDLSPYTKFTIYLPFIGFRDISANDIYNKRIKVVYDIDFSDGNCKCIILVSNGYLPNVNGDYTPMYIFDGNVAQEIPLNVSDKNVKAQNAVKGVIGSAVGVAAGAATGGVASGVGAAMIGSTVANSVVQSGTDLLLNKPNYKAGGTTNNQFAYAINDCVPFIIQEYPDSNVPSNIQKVYGFTCNFYDTLSKFRGMTVCQNIQNISFGLDAEKDEIKTLLEKGVIING